MTLGAKIAGLNPADVLITDWQPGTQHRVYDNRFAPDAFNPTPFGNARFSPLHVTDTAAAGGTRIVPTMYTGETVEVALMEVVLRDVPTPSAGHIVRLPSPTKELRRVTEIHIAQPASAPVATPPPIKVADLRANGLRRLGLTRTEVVECDATGYPETRSFGRWIYENRPDAQGIIWTSRQQGSRDAAILFGDRLSGFSVVAVNANQPINSGPAFAALVSLIGQLGAGLHIDP